MTTESVPAQRGRTTAFGDSSSDGHGSSLVSTGDLESLLLDLRARCTDPKGGLFGPGSKLWDINRHAVLFLGSGRAALLQLAHPHVAQAIHDHSSTRADPLGRFQRTFANVFDMVFGDLDTALAAAVRVHGVHSRTVGRMEETAGAHTMGTPYHANQPDALLWVHATLWETSVVIFERVVRPLDLAEKNVYYRQTRLFARLFGIPDTLLPANWREFEDYNREMWNSGRLAVSQRAAEIGEFLFQPRHRLAAPVFRRLRAVTAGLLPAAVRDGFGLPFDGRQQRICRQTLAWARRTHRFWPGRLRYIPAYLEALRRIRGHTGHDRLGEWLSRLYVGPPRGPR